MSLTIKILLIISSNIQIKVFKTRLKYCLFVCFLGNWNTIFHTKFYRVLEHIRIILILSHVMPVPLILILHVKHDNFRIFCGLSWTFRQFFYNLGFSKPPSSAELTQIFYTVSSFHSKSSPFWLKWTLWEPSPLWIISCLNTRQAFQNSIYWFSPLLKNVLTNLLNSLFSLQ